MKVLYHQQDTQLRIINREYLALKGDERFTTQILQRLQHNTIWKKFPKGETTDEVASDLYLEEYDDLNWLWW